MRAAVYARLSNKKNESELGMNITDQQATGLAVVAERGWTLVDGPDDGTFTDNGRGAFKDNAKRPMWDAMLAAKPDVVVVRDISRLGRRVEDWVELKNTVGRAVIWLDRYEINYDAALLKTADMDFLVKMTGSRQSSIDTGERVANKIRVKASKGAWPHGGTRPYGYHHPPNCCGADACRPGVIIAEEAAVILDTAERWLAGASLSALCRDLTNRGVLTPKAKPWQYARLRSMLSGPRIAGIRTHNKVETPGQWPAIVDADLHRRLKTAASESMMRRANENGTYLLTSIVWCGTCEQKMYGLTQRSAAGSRVRYVCRGPQGCGAGIAGPQTDEFVANRSFMSILAPELQDQAQSRRELKAVQDELTDLRSRVEELDAAYWTDRSIQKDRWLTLSNSLGANVVAKEALESDLKQRLSRLRDAPTTAEALGRRWKDADTRERNRLLRVGVERVVIYARRPGKSAFDPTRIEIRFNDGKVEGFRTEGEPVPA